MRASRQNMRQTQILLGLFAMQATLMYLSYTMNPKVLPETLMVLFISGLLVLGSYIGGLLAGDKGQIEGPSSSAIRRVLNVAIPVYVFSLLANLLINRSSVDFSSYYSIRNSLMWLSFSFPGIIIQISQAAVVLFSGALLAAEINSNRLIGWNRSYVYIALGLTLPFFGSGSRSLLIFFMASLAANLSSIKRIFKSKAVIFIFLLALSSLLAMGIIRHIPNKNKLLPIDSFLVGPHLLHKNIDTIKEQRKVLDNQVVPPGYALLSGLYVGTNVICNYFGIKVFYYHLERVFWTRHHFDYIAAFGKKYNSYYTAGLAVVIEGWVRVGILSFLLGFLPCFMRDKFSRLIYLPLLYFFAFSLFKVSIFQNFGYSFWLIGSILLELRSRLFGPARGFFSKSSMKNT